MRIESSVTSVSWIPSEAVAGMTKSVFEVGFSHYDDAPPDDIGPDIPATLEALRAADRLRFANHLAAFAEFADDGSVVDAGYRGGGHDRLDDRPARQAVRGGCGQPSRPAARTRDR